MAETAETFETYRPYLFSIAYRMLSTAMDGEDMVQETWVRYQATPPETIGSLKAYLSTILIRLCVGQLHLARRTREQYVGPWLPEPILTEITSSGTGDPAAGDPAERVERDDSISLAFLVLLERLQPFERAVFLLREVFEYDYVEIATMLDKSEAACRQSFSRAKKRLGDHQPRFTASAETHRQLLSAYFQAVQHGNMTALKDQLAAGVTLWADSGGAIKQAALRPIHGQGAVARFSVGTFRFLPEDYQLETADVNGQPALIVRVGAQALFVLSIDIEAGRIQAIRVMANPEKVTRI